MDDSDFPGVSVYREPPRSCHWPMRRARVCRSPSVPPSHCRVAHMPAELAASVARVNHTSPTAAAARVHPTGEMPDATRMYVARTCVPCSSSLVQQGSPTYPRMSPTVSDRHVLALFHCRESLLHQTHETVVHVLQAGRPWLLHFAGDLSRRKPGARLRLVCLLHTWHRRRTPRRRRWRKLMWGGRYWQHRRRRWDREEVLRRVQALRDRPAVRSRRQHCAPPGDSCAWCGRIVSSAVGAGSFPPALAVLQQSQRTRLHVQRLSEQLLCPIGIQMIVTLSFPLPRHGAVARWRSGGEEKKRYHKMLTRASMHAHS